ncbi:tetratricopeptide repeat-containing response regulator [Alkalimarinus alittae]|uniref:Response regulator n=1 Tax=Alkalimarinus alittae TaxID=2961619 RepID=A0ABY6N1S7_9ALTE|nr:tetratricopeptide repeat-containing response regulator [Alkalimarinus alittae]UZE95947.1 response regulator [Alkalimarinus alittae]
MYFREYTQTRFLIIDSNIKLRMIMEEYLKSYGAWFIDFAADGVDAVEKCKNGVFDVVLCDYNLGPKNGQQVLEELRHKKYLKHASLFVMMSADTTKDMVLGAIEYQPDAYISKPITRDSLKQRLDSLLIDSEALYEIKYSMDCDEVDEAIYLCEQKIRKRSKYASWCHKTKASLFLQTERFKEAKDVYNEVLQTRPLLWAKIGLAKVAIEEKQYTTAEPILEGIIEHNPLCLIAYDLLADIQIKTKRKKAAQETLFEAVARSPRAIQRHIKLGELCIENQDYEIATEAFRNATEHGEQSIYQNANNYLNFARCLNETSVALTPPLRDSRSEEALGAIGTAQERFGEEEAVNFQSNMIKARIHKTCERTEQAEQALTEAQDVYLMIAAELPPEMAMEYAQTLFNLDKENDAEMVLNHLSALHSNNAEVMHKIDALRDEPVSWQNRTKAAELNKAGIQHVEAGNHREAIAVFRDALTYSPKHPALNLNMTQVLLKLIPTEQNNNGSIKLCQQCLANASHIKSDHKQFKRYEFLKAKLAKLVAKTS